MNPSSIIIFGQDASLMETRSWLLEDAGHLVTRVMTSSELQRAILSRQHELLILCHSLSTQEYADSLVLAFPLLPTILLYPGALSSVPPQGVAVVNTFDGPASLLRAVKSMLNESRNNTRTSKISNSIG